MLAYDLQARPARLAQEKRQHFERGLATVKWRDQGLLAQLAAFAVYVVLATWAYPDGCAAVLAARALGKPCVVKVHGSDVNPMTRSPAL